VNVLPGRGDRAHREEEQPQSRENFPMEANEFHLSLSREARSFYVTSASCGVELTRLGCAPRIAISPYFGPKLEKSPPNPRPGHE